MSVPADKGLSGFIISTGKAVLVHDYLDTDQLANIEVIHFGDPDHIRAFVAVPMKLGNKVVGMLSSQSYQPHKYTIEDQQMLEVLAAHAAIALDNAQLFSQVQKLAITDSLTEVYNRRHFFDIAQKEFQRSVRYQHPLSVIMLDIDHYKFINDTYGHVVGDLALKAIAHQLQENIRETDTLGRYGGDEFSILLTETDLDGALEIAERIRSTINQKCIKVDIYEFSFTISLGVASLNQSMTDLSQLLMTADLALYDAKKLHRNQVRHRIWPLDISVRDTINNGERIDASSHND
jgi:diguanylate cyclase (GGDEF)-like protein